MFINYDKLAKKIVENLNYSDKRDIIDSLANKIAKVISSDTEMLNELKEDLTVTESRYDGFSNYKQCNIPLKEYIGNKVADQLVPEVYNLNKAEILKEVSEQGILNLLQEKLQESAKQQVLDFVTKPIKLKE